jgi:UDP-N-acetylglucosamine:LPS N-acetylglucosamine transferase
MGRIVIVSASLGAGHDGAARALAHRLRAAGHEVSGHDFLDLLPGRLGAVLRAAYRRQLAVAPNSWEWLLTRLERRRCAALVIGLAMIAGPGLRRIAVGADAVVCTYPLAGQVAAWLRRRRLAAPVCVYPTDPAVHPLWIARGADLYLAAHPGIARQVGALGGGRVVVVAPAVRPEFRPPVDAAERARARARFGLPADDVVALVMSGAWGVGDLAGSARDVAAVGTAVPVVVCGENTALRRRLSDLPGVVLGWVADLPELMRACDVVVLNSGGTTFFEAQAAGLPVVHYRCLPGHARTNAALLARAGLARWAADRTELAAALSRTGRLDAPTGHRPCPTTVISALLDRPASTEPPRARGFCRPVIGSAPAKPGRAGGVRQLPTVGSVPVRSPRPRVPRRPPVIGAESSEWSRPRGLRWSVAAGLSPVGPPRARVLRRPVAVGPALARPSRAGGLRWSTPVESVPVGPPRVRAPRWPVVAGLVAALLWTFTGGAGVAVAHGIDVARVRADRACVLVENRVDRAIDPIAARRPAPGRKPLSTKGSSS